MSFGPLLTARIGVAGDAPQSFGQVGAAGRSDEALRGKDHVGGDTQQRIVHHRALVGIEHDAQAAPPRGRADRPDENGKPVVGQHDVGGGGERFGVGRDDGGDPLVAVGHDGAVAARVDEDCRQRRRQSGNALTGRAVDLLARERRQHEVTVGVGAHRSGEHCAAAEPRHCDRGVGGATAVDDEKFLCLHLAIGRRQILDVKDLVEHDDTGAQDAWCARLRWTHVARGVLGPRHLSAETSVFGDVSRAHRRPSRQRR